MSTPHSEKFLPWWVWAIAFIEMIVPTYFAVATVIDPSVWGEDTLGAIGQLYVTRNITMAAGVGLALLLRSHTALFVAVFARYATDFIDIVAGFLRGPDPETQQVLIVFTVVLLVLPLFGLGWLFRRLKSQTGQ
ncbi:MAG: hypothetical protein AAGH45_05065 [Pseudomonadota bacterium]